MALLDRAARDPLIAVLREPVRMLALDASSWSSLLFRARKASLTGRLGALAEREGLNERLPPKVRDVFTAATITVAHNQQRLRREVRCLRRALAPLGVPIVLLKGAAYLWADLPPAAGRLASDVDILVAPSDLERAERALLEAGWEQAKLDAYDQHYYRTWMHEVPPLQHRERRVTVDLHHAIHPPTGRLRLSTPDLIRCSRRIDHGNLFVFNGFDIVLHTIVHVFQDGDLSSGLRELVDLDSLLRHFGTESSFWDAAERRAESVGAGRAWYYGLRYSRALLATPIPDEALARAERWAPPPPIRSLMDLLVSLSLPPTDPDIPVRGSALSRFLLYVRSHWLRMPPLLLARHLVRKALKRTKL